MKHLYIMNNLMNEVSNVAKKDIELEPSALISICVFIGFFTLFFIGGIIIEILKHKKGKNKKN